MKKSMGYAAYYLIPLLCILIPLHALVAMVAICWVVYRRKPRFFLWPVVLGLAGVGYVTHMAWQMWHGFWAYMKCSSC